MTLSHDYAVVASHLGSSLTVFEEVMLRVASAWWYSSPSFHRAVWYDLEISLLEGRLRQAYLPDVHLAVRCCCRPSRWRRISLHDSRCRRKRRNRCPLRRAFGAVTSGRQADGDGPCDWRRGAWARRRISPDATFVWHGKHRRHGQAARPASGILGDSLRFVARPLRFTVLTVI